MNPLQMVAREMAQYCDMTESEIVEAITGLFSHLNQRAYQSIQEDVNSAQALQNALQYRVVTELVTMLGSQLIAFEQIEQDDSDGITN